MIDNAFDSPEGDIVFLGINYYGTCGEKGKGPELIRQAINSFSSYNPESKIDAFNKLIISDIGDVTATNYEQLRTKVINKIKTIKGMPLILGGEHLVTLPVIEALKPENVLIFDAHADYFNTYKGNKHSYATVARRISEIAKKVLIVGVRDLTLEEANDLSKPSNTELVSINELPNKMGKGKWYISIDLDVLDPIYCPEVSTPIPLGISMNELVKVLNNICINHEIAGLDVVELTAKNKGLSSINAGGIIMNYLKWRCMNG